MIRFFEVLFYFILLYKFLYIYIVIVRDLEIGIRFKKQEWKKFEEIQFEQLEGTWGEQITRHCVNHETVT